jgi:hypothetical protein
VRNFLYLVIVASGGWLLLNAVGVSSLDPRGVGTRMEGSRVVRDEGDLETRFARTGQLDETWMLFGGDATQRRNQATHGSFAGLPLRHARAIAARHPDFHLCRSPGAEDAKRHIESVNVVVADRAARAALADAVGLFDARLGRPDSERTCVSIRGAPLTLESVTVKQNGEDLTAQVAPLYQRTKLVLAERVEIRDCRPLLGR